MPARPYLACALALLAVLAGCTAVPAADPVDSPSAPSPNATDSADNGSDAGDGNGSPPASPGGPDPGYDAYVFDHAGAPAPAVEGGIVYDAENSTTRRYVTLVTTQSEADERFNRSVLDADARAFVGNTSFEESYLVVFQTVPASSTPDYRVESIGRDDEVVSLRVNDSAHGGTSDVTVETLLVRLPRGEAPPERAVVVTEENATVRSGAGVVSGAPDGHGTETEDEENETALPYRGRDAESNLEDPLAVRVHNAGPDINGFRVNLTYVGGDEAVPVFDSGWKKLPAGRNWTVGEAVARTGAYRVRVVASLPADDGSRRRVSTTAIWNVSAASGPLRARITDENVTVTVGTGTAST